MKLPTPCVVLCAVVVTLGGSSGLAQTAPPAAVPQVTVAAPATVAAEEVPSRLARAGRLYRTGEVEAAEREYTTLIESAPESALAYVGLVHVALRLRKNEEAYTAAAKALALAPCLDAAHVALGEIYFRQGKLVEAEKEFTALVKARTNEPRAYLGLSRVYKAASFYKHSKLAIDRAYSLDSDDPDIRRAWIATLSPQERIKALKAFLSGKANVTSEAQQRIEVQIAALEESAGRSIRQCKPVARPALMETKLEMLLDGPNYLRGFGLGVKINGTSSRLLLDTGAGGIVIDRKIAERAGIKRISDTEIRGIGDKGGKSGYLGYADSIRVGDLEFQDCYVEVIDKGSVISDDGLIGTVLFSDFLVDIDFPRWRLRLSPLPPRPDEGAAAQVAAGPSAPAAPEFNDRYVAPEMKGFTQVMRFGHQLLVPTRVNDADPRLFLLDTGAFNNTISPAAAREVTGVSSDSNTRVIGLSGSVKRVFSADQLTLTFGSLRQKNLDVVSFDTTGLSDNVGTEVAGILGFAMLRMLELKIDYRDGLVDFIYGQKDRR